MKTFKLIVAVLFASAGPIAHAQSQTVETNGGDEKWAIHRLGDLTAAVLTDSPNGVTVTWEEGTALCKLAIGGSTGWRRMDREKTTEFLVAQEAAGRRFDFGDAWTAERQYSMKFSTATPDAWGGVIPEGKRRVLCVGGDVPLPIPTKPAVTLPGGAGSIAAPSPSQDHAQSLSQGQSSKEERREVVGEGKTQACFSREQAMKLAEVSSHNDANKECRSLSGNWRYGGKKFDGYSQCTACKSPGEFKCAVTQSVHYCVRRAK
jgi:hypothetical protein